MTPNDTNTMQTELTKHTVFKSVFKPAKALPYALCLMLACTAHASPTNGSVTNSKATNSKATNSSTTNQTPLPKGKVAIDASSQTTKAELAVMKVFYDLCPTLLPKKQHSRFFQQHNALLKKMLPNISEPTQAFKALTDDAEFTRLVTQNQKENAKFSDADNLSLCQDIANMP